MNLIEGLSVSKEAVAQSYDELNQLQHEIDHVAHLLPAQGPIHVFIHHNTLHAFEHLPFDEAVQLGAKTFGTQPYLTEERYRQAWLRGRIRNEHLRAIVAQELGNDMTRMIAGLSTLKEIRMAMLENALWSGTENELKWWMEESDALRKFSARASQATLTRQVAENRRWIMRDGRKGSASVELESVLRRYSVRDIEIWDESTWEAVTLDCLWTAICNGVAQVPRSRPAPKKPARLSSAIHEITGRDPDHRVNELLIRYSAAFLDQGVSVWALPDRSEGMYKAFLRSYSLEYGPPDEWLIPLRTEAIRLLEQNKSALESIAESLQILGISHEDWESFLGETLLALRGWGGIIRQVEERGDRVAHGIPKGSLVDFLAIRLVLDRLSLQHMAHRELGYEGSLADLRADVEKRLPEPKPDSIPLRAIVVFELAQILGWTTTRLFHLSQSQWEELLGVVESFHSLERRRLFHQAYEMRFREQTLDAIALNKPRPVAKPKFQVIACLDEREESFRRHLEEIEPGCETFGAAGFFNVAIYYKGVADSHFTPLCPIVLTPQHWVEEHVCEDRIRDNNRKAQTRKVVANASHMIHLGTRSIAVGALLTVGLGVVASIPLVGRILFPGISGRIRRMFGRVMNPPTSTQLKLERQSEKASLEKDGIGYSVNEMSATAERFLRDVGMTRQFANIIYILGHGSISLNNPHKSAYDCGACGGSPGAPNGRALSQMLNDKRVREMIRANGINIPDTTTFVGGFHNTCDDSVQLFDTDRVPEAYQGELQDARRAFEECCDRNAHERSRRFMSAPLQQSLSDARWHVQNRSEDLAQTRPELGHATNAICYVGRRERTRGLYLDRRAFLASYDPNQDDEIGSTLIRLLGAAVPVCAGINLEYYFSHVDSPGYGCGTKLPHNITSLLGVMDGAQSDMRTGLPWQMVEIHEPVRLLFVVETRPEVIFKIMDRSEVIGRHIRNGWVQLSLLDPDSGKILLYKDGVFVPYVPSTSVIPHAESSLEWYRGWREHLEFAVIG